MRLQQIKQINLPKTGDILRPKHILLQLFVSEGNSLSTRTILEGNSKDSFLFSNSKMKASMKLCCHYAIGFSDNQFVATFLFKDLLRQQCIQIFLQYFKLLPPNDQTYYSPHIFYCSSIHRMICLSHFKRECCCKFTQKHRE